MQTDHASIDKNIIRAASTNILIEIFKNIRNSQYLKKLGLSSLFNSYFDNETDAFDQTRREQFLNDFKEKLPLSEYSDYEEFIDKIYANAEEDILFPGLPDLFTISSGTISGKSKVYPFSLKNFQKTVFPPESLIQFLNKSGFNDFNRNSKGILLNTRLIKAYSPVKNVPVCTVSSILKFDNDVEPSFVKNDTNYTHRIIKGLIYSLTSCDLEYIYSIFLSTVADFFSIFEQNFISIMDHIENGTLPKTNEDNENNFLSGNGNEDGEISLKPNKTRADEIRSICIDNNGVVVIKNKLKQIWPKLTVILGVFSGSFEPFLNICRTYCGDVLYLNTTYSSSEGINATAVPISNNSYIVNSSDRSFLEFIPDNSNEILTPDELELDKYYEVVITSVLTGLIRYKMGDVIKMIGWFNKMPVFSIIGRKNLSLRINYEVKEQELIDGFKELDLNAMYAFFSDTKKHPPCLGLFIECDSRSHDKKLLSKKLHSYLKETNEFYRLTTAKNEENIPISIYFVEKNGFIGLNGLKAEKLGIKTTTQIKPIKIIYNDDEIDFLLKKSI